MCATMPSPKKVSSRWREERVHAVPGAVEKLVRDHEIERLVLFLQRTDRRNRNNALHSQLLKAVNVGPEIQLARQEFVAAGMAREKCHLAASQRPQNVRIRRISKWSLLLDLVRASESRHLVQTAAADNANLCLLQMRS